jgi:hypothetical protein
MKIGRYSGELSENIFLINPLNFDLRTFLRELPERCSNHHVGITMF